MREKKKKMIFPLLIMGVFLLFSSGCEKDGGKELSSNDQTNGKTTAIFNPSVTYGSLSDQDGNLYKTVTIGTQTWMAENLRTTKYNDGVPIPNITDNNHWSSRTDGAYCNYENSEDYDTIATYGRLYNWYAINTLKLAPKGWHVPTLAEWRELIDYLGGEDFSGNKLREFGTTHWYSDHNEITNETGFTALPGGLRRLDGTFERIGRYSYWWFATEYNNTSHEACYWKIYIDWGGVEDEIAPKEFGLSVRCVRD